MLWGLKLFRNNNHIIVEKNRENATITATTLIWREKYKYIHFIVFIIFFSPFFHGNQKWLCRDMTHQDVSMNYSLHQFMHSFWHT